MVGPRTRSRRIRIHLLLTAGAASSEGTWKAKLARLRQFDGGGPVELRNATRPTGITSTHFSRRRVSVAQIQIPCRDF